MTLQPLIYIAHSHRTSTFLVVIPIREQPRDWRELSEILPHKPFTSLRVLYIIIKEQYIEPIRGQYCTTNHRAVDTPTQSDKLVTMVMYGIPITRE